MHGLGLHLWACWREVCYSSIFILKKKFRMTSALLSILPCIIYTMSCFQPQTTCDLRIHDRSYNQHDRGKHIQRTPAIGRALMVRIRGIMKWVSVLKGHGFVTANYKSEEVFAHRPPKQKGEVYRLLVLPSCIGFQNKVVYLSLHEVESGPV